MLGFEIFLLMNPEDEEAEFFYRFRKHFSSPTQNMRKRRFQSQTPNHVAILDFLFYFLLVFFSLFTKNSRIENEIITSSIHRLIWCN